MQRLQGVAPWHAAGVARRAVATPAAAANVVAETAVAAAVAVAGPAGPLLTLSFTPVHAVLGGIILGTAASAKLLTTGRILGISGAMKGLVNGDFAPWRFAFLGGLLAGSAVLGLVLPEAFQAMRGSCPLWRAAISGLLVGIGTSMGNGCTSGHGICGSARLSPRSFAYTASFMASGMLSATLTQSARCQGVRPVPPQLVLPTPAEWQLALSFLASGVAAFAGLALLAKLAYARSGKPEPHMPSAAALASAMTAGIAGEATAAGGGVVLEGGQPHVAAAGPAFELSAEFGSGLLFALGLGFSGMAHATKVVSFLSPLYPCWDLSLPFVMGGAVLVALLAFQGVLRFHMMQHPLFMSRFQFPTANAIDTRLLTGGVLFGAGWGMSGLCPGPALLSLIISHDAHVYWFLISMVAGMALEHHWLSHWMAPGAPHHK
ncbi:hypothetical protein HYH02_005127 [Chlamydomonas schloesseri]|uniref:Sulphur transport domain-containing protein n=1 Tax=Chlamydomonas schloesseri TaxID=2026947 RepID=A0A835WKW6_9CHLO|nr:hypothetical protein HYH02_005127 [Chlamydomonas schloesseri]|eukprot:KAG2449594.1 hypothetical protein HYH02_005127 [Chlamydomonas schloesseri]